MEKQIISQFSLPAYIKGKTFADASKAISNKFKDRTDKASNDTKQDLLARLAKAQEYIKMQEAMKNESQQIPDQMNGQVPAGMEEFSQNKAASGGMFDSLAPITGIAGPSSIPDIGGGLGGMNVAGAAGDLLSAGQQIFGDSGIDNNLTKYIKDNYGTPAAAIQKKTQKPFKESIAQEFSIDDSTFLGRGKVQSTIEHSRYLSENGELYPRIMEMRKILNVKPGDIINDEQVQEVKSKTDNPLFKYYTDEQIKEMLNTLAMNERDSRPDSRLV